MIGATTLKNRILKPKLIHRSLTSLSQLSLGVGAYLYTSLVLADSSNDQNLGKVASTITSSFGQ